MDFSTSWRHLPGCWWRPHCWEGIYILVSLIECSPAPSCHGNRKKISSDKFHTEISGQFSLVYLNTTEMMTPLNHVWRVQMESPWYKFSKNGACHLPRLAHLPSGEGAGKQSYWWLMPCSCPQLRLVTSHNPMTKQWTYSVPQPKQHLLERET